MEKEIKRPFIGEYSDPVDFIRDMVGYRKKTEAHFSVLRATRSLRKISPTLVTLILKRKRSINLDRADEFSKLLNLNSAEKHYFKNWLKSKEEPLGEEVSLSSTSSRKNVGVHILNNWLNVYVKDYFMLRAVQKDPNLIYEKLAQIASPKKIQQSLNFLLQHGYLRKNLKGDIVVETNLDVAESPVPHKKIRNFHKKALGIARNNIDIFPASERLANAATVALTEESYEELLELIQEFTNKFKDFAERANAQDAESYRLYQMIINLSPVGGEVHDK